MIVIKIIHLNTTTNISQCYMLQHPSTDLSRTVSAEWKEYNLNSIFYDYLCYILKSDDWYGKSVRLTVFTVVTILLTLLTQLPAALHPTTAEGRALGQLHSKGLKSGGDFWKVREVSVRLSTLGLLYSRDTPKAFNRSQPLQRLHCSVQDCLEINGSVEGDIFTTTHPHLLQSLQSKSSGSSPVSSACLRETASVCSSWLEVRRRRERVANEMVFIVTRVWLDCQKKDELRNI